MGTVSVNRLMWIQIDILLNTLNLLSLPDQVVLGFEETSSIFKSFQRSLVIVLVKPSVFLGTIDNFKFYKNRSRYSLNILNH